MGLYEQLHEAENRRQSATQSSTAEKAEYFLLIGVNLVDDNGNTQFVSLPVPLGLDTMKPNRVYGQGDFQESLLKGNDLLKNLQDLAVANLAPGEEISLEELTVKIRRRAVKREISHTPRAFNFTIKR